MESPAGLGEKDRELPTPKKPVFWSMGTWMSTTPVTGLGVLALGCTFFIPLEPRLVTRGATFWPGPHPGFLFVPGIAFLLASICCCWLYSLSKASSSSCRLAMDSFWPPEFLP